MPSKKGAIAQSSPACLSCGNATKLISEKKGEFEIRSYVCKKCGWKMTHPDDAKLILMRQSGVKTSIGKLGRQTILRIPASIREMYKLDSVREVTLKPISRNKFEIGV